MCSLAEYYKKRDVFYFSSESFADEEVVELVLSSQKNSLFLFYSNSISPDVYALIIKLSIALKENNNYSKRHKYFLFTFQISLSKIILR